MRLIRITLFICIVLTLTGCNTINSQSIASDFSSPCNRLGDFFQGLRYANSDNYLNQRLIVEDINMCIERLNVNGEVKGLETNMTKVRIIMNSDVHKED